MNPIQGIGGAGAAQAPAAMQGQQSADGAAFSEAKGCSGGECGGGSGGPEAGGGGAMDEAAVMKILEAIISTLSQMMGDSAGGGGGEQGGGSPQTSLDPTKRVAGAGQGATA